MPVPLSGLTFYRKADVNPATSGIDTFWNALYTALSATVDYRGNTVANTHLWSIGRFQNGANTEAVYATPPAGTAMTKAPAIIYAGDAAGSALTISSNDTSGANKSFIGINKNSGAYSNWKVAQPFTSGQFSGFWQLTPTSSLGTGTIIRCYVSQETIFVQIIQATVTSQSWSYAGAIVEPYTNDTTVAAETDNRLYGVVTTGGALVSGSWLSSGAASGAVFSNSELNGGVHSGLFVPNSASFMTGGRRNHHIQTVGPDEALTPEGYPVGDIMEWGKNTASLQPNGTRYGTIRGIYQTGSVRSGRWLRNGTTDMYHYISTDPSGSGNGIMVPAAP